MGLYLSLRREVDGFLEGEVHEFKAILLHEADDDLEEIEEEIRAELGSRKGTDLTFRLLDPAGRLLITSDPADRFPNPWKLIDETQGDTSQKRFELIEEPTSSLPYRFCWERVILRGRGEVIVQAGYRMDRVRRSLYICRWVCFASLGFAALLSVLGGHAVARSSLRPVAAITGVARQISAKNLSMRVPRSGANDELDDLADTLNNMLERVEGSFRQIRQFTADAAHELRTPLTALRGTAEHALARPRSVEQLRAAIEQSLEYYRVLARVTDDLLLLARIDAGQDPLRIERFSLPGMIEDVVDLYRPLAADYGINLQVECGSELWVMADCGKIRRVLSNLLDNAIKYMEGAGTVCMRLASEDDTAVISVIDTGPGIPMEDLPHVFERFYRVDRSRMSSPRANSRSVGLGLAICRSIVLAHHGEITIKSCKTRGTEVVLAIPLSDAHAATADNGTD